MMKLVLVLLFAAYAYGCGKPTYEPSVSRVVNGVDARPYSWPWQISLQYLSGYTYRHTCGGTLLTPEWVMTAGHCIGPRTYRVVVGEYDLTKEESYEQVRSVAKIVVHPNWDDNCLSCGNDIAMIKLASPVDLNDKVQPPCLPESEQIVPHNDPCYITGWGRLYSGGPIASKLQQALLPVVGHSVCSRSDWWGSTVKTTMVCAGGDIRSGCHGDSGGPLNCRGGDGRWYVQGVTSFVSSRGCNTPLKPTVFTRTSSFTKWISDVSSPQRKKQLPRASKTTSVLKVEDEPKIKINSLIWWLRALSSTSLHGRPFIKLLKVKSVQTFTSRQKQNALEFRSLYRC